MDKRNCMFCEFYFITGSYEECSEGKLQKCDKIIEREHKTKLKSMKTRKLKDLKERKLKTMKVEGEVDTIGNTPTTSDTEY